MIKGTQLVELLLKYPNMEIKLADGSEIKHVGMICGGEQSFIVLSDTVPTKVCSECGNNVFPETKVEGYSYYCPCCDENKYETEVENKKTHR